MDGLCRAIGAPVPVEILGSMRLMWPMRLLDFGTLENCLLNRRVRPVRIAVRKIEEMPRELAELLVKEAVAMERELPNHIPPDELQQWMQTRDGAALALWLMLLRSDPKIRHSECVDHIRDLGDEAFADLLCTQAMVNGLTDVAERDWLVVQSEDGDEDEGDGEERKRFNWKYAVRQMCEAYMGLTPELCGQLTLFTFRMLYLDSGNVKGRRVSLSEWRAEQKKKQQREAKEG